MGLFGFFKNKKQKNTVQCSTTSSNCAVPTQNEKSKIENKKTNEWKLLFYNEIQQSTDWMADIDDERRKQSILEGIKNNAAIASNWKTVIANTTPDYGSGPYGAASDAVFSNNIRCICFQKGDDIYNIEYVCIDLRSGKPYISAEQTCGGPGGSFVTSYRQRVISWEDFQKYAACVSDEISKFYAGINDDNWQNFLNPKYVYFRV